MKSTPVISTTLPKYATLNYSVKQVGKTQTIVDPIDDQYLLYADHTTTSTTGGKYVTGEDYDKKYMDA